MYRNVIRQKVGEIFKGLFTEEDYSIVFGYDCVDIELSHPYNQIYTDTIRELEEFFHNSTLIYATTVDGKCRIVLMYDVTDLIVEEYGTFSAYEKNYGYTD